MIHNSATYFESRNGELGVVVHKACMDDWLGAGDGNYAGGPVTGTHWVKSGTLLCGRSPSLMSDDELKRLVGQVGVNVFICLQQRYDEYAGDDYQKRLARIVPTVQCRGDGKVRLLHMPIPDHGVVDDASMLARVQEIVALLRQNPPPREQDEERYGDAAVPARISVCILVHCFSGHGRTGSVLVNVLSALDTYSYVDAMHALRCSHTLGRKECHGGWGSSLYSGKLEDRSQEAQAQRLQPVTQGRQAYISKN
jgi:hypothetical protein